MKKTNAYLITALLSLSFPALAAPEGTFRSDVEFVAKHAKTIVLKHGDARVLLVPDYQGRVMTSTAGGDGGTSYGYLNYKVIQAGRLSAEQQRGKLEDHIYVFGGEERFWLGPEGGQYAIFFAPGSEFKFDVWHTPAVIDTEAFEVVSASDTEARFSKAFTLKNWSGTEFTGKIERDVKLLDAPESARALGVSLPPGVRTVCYETVNRLTNTGKAPWTPDRGLLSIWLLGMYKPGPRTTIVIPFKAGSEKELGAKVNDSYFGSIPGEYLIVKERVLFFKGDGTRRGKIGINPRRSLGIAGSYDAETRTLTLVSYNRQAAPNGYVNSMWQKQEAPYAGDVLNSYNDGSPGEGKPPLGPFYEIETSSPAAALKPGETMTHISRTIHIQGAESDLDQIAKKKLGASLKEIAGAFAKETRSFPVCLSVPNHHKPVGIQ